MIPKTPVTYSDVFAALDQVKAPYVVVSGTAVVLHGHVRPVYDLDIVISQTPPEQMAALQAVMSAGFFPSISVPLNLLSVVRMFDQEAREVDVFRQYHLSFKELWEDSVEISVGETVARVASFENVIKAKRIVGRPHDLEDVAGLLKLANDNRPMSKVRTPISL
ncbi:MAG TPA: hypothetical protein VLL54_22195 [Pyrinomonadaceae bacterium]|nr:hypothetical protein [Pyrinomonadaceae bacterium]